MTESNENQNTSGAEDSQVSVASSTESHSSEESNQVSYDTHKRLLAQRKADQRRVQELEARLGKFEEEKQTLREKELAEKGQYEQIKTQYQQKLQELEQKEQEARRREVQRNKLEAFASALPGKLKHPKYLAFVEADEIVINPETGTVDELSLKSAVEAFLKEHGSLVSTETPTQSKIPSRASSAPTLDGNQSKEERLKELLIKSNY